MKRIASPKMKDKKGVDQDPHLFALQERAGLQRMIQKREAEMQKLNLRREQVYKELQWIQNYSAKSENQIKLGSVEQMNPPFGMPQYGQMPPMAPFDRRVQALKEVQGQRMQMPPFNHMAFGPGMGFAFPGMNPELSSKHQPEFFAKQQTQMVNQTSEIGSDPAFKFDVQSQTAQPDVLNGAGGEPLGKEALECLKRVESRLQSTEGAQIVAARLAEQQEQFSAPTQQQYVSQEVFPGQAFAPQMLEEAAYPGPFGFQPAEEQVEATA